MSETAPQARTRGRPKGTTKDDNKIKTGVAMRRSSWTDLDELCADGKPSGEEMARGDLLAELIEAEKKRRAKLRQRQDATS